MYTLLYLPPHYIFLMNYSVLNIGQLLFLLGNEGLKQRFPNWEARLPREARTSAWGGVGGKTQKN